MDKPVVPEIWGGIECTINRVQNSYLDQLEVAGYYSNTNYTDAVISLGIQNIRFPVLWEKHQPLQDTKIDWSYTENLLQQFREHNIEPIAGLLHHGSGPAFTNLLEDNFPELFAQYAAEVAARFPWIGYYTPVNEPLTTARFSGLYGLWYPHKKNDASFLRILLNELMGTVLAMQEIRKVNPDAKLVQTEDLGKTYSTPLLSYQANFENERRWLTWDILCGRVTPSHPLWNYIIRLGIPEQKLQFFIDNPCPPDVIGVNHYLTSERFLDEEIEHYPIETWGGNSRHRYADTEAVRVDFDEPHGLEYLLKELWKRYEIPVAITEVHLNCTREEQLKWFHQVHTIAVKLGEDGVNIRAVTAWALLGSYGWNKLLTSPPGDYETGVFDISAGYPRPTALAAYITAVASQQKVDNPVINQIAWWQRDCRYYKRNRAREESTHHTVQPVVIIGRTGQLGTAFAKICGERNLHCVLLGREEADICNEDKLIEVIKKYRPWAIINAAGKVNIDEAESDNGGCYKVNYLGVELLSAICSKLGIKLLSFSSDFVFDGDKEHPYIETDTPNPLNRYGKSKQLGERSICKENKDALVIRTAAFFGSPRRQNFVHHLLTELKSGKSFVAANDVFVSPTYIPHLVHASLDLLIDNAAGIWHLTNKGSITWYEFAKKIAAYTPFNTELITPGYDIKTAAKLPAMSALQSIKYSLMPSLDEALEEYFLTDREVNQIIKTKITADEII
ncbi:family 1 glycosylhydrolase [Ferruginibacter paludis]|uniref:family 1 glycosylhydrolase n=1 Tax=Ferruginibacter paludis TaxID=1310417 RepID=UPI0025B4D8B4|nr:family 1 glycosylhydrolase [Ferruginibacter paludis]MDN3656160.1 family 1 glycosylhydrolase [Ferruginibacter paludis]